MHYITCLFAMSFSYTVELSFGTRLAHILRAEIIHGASKQVCFSTLREKSDSRLSLRARLNGNAMFYEAFIEKK